MGFFWDRTRRKSVRRNSSGLGFKQSGSLQVRHALGIEGNRHLWFSATESKCPSHRRQRRQVGPQGHGRATQMSRESIKKKKNRWKTPMVCQDKQRLPLVFETQRGRRTFLGEKKEGLKGEFFWGQWRVEAWQQ